MSSRVPFVVGFGIACVDYIVVAPRTAPGGRSDATEFCIQGGGLTGTSIVAAARLGAKAKLLGRVGADESGDQVVRDLRAEGVDASELIQVPGAQSLISVVIVDADTAERTIYSRLDIGIDCSTDLINIQPVREADSVVLDPHWKEGAMLVARSAKDAGVPIVCDVNNPVRHKDLLALCDYPIISLSSALRLVDTGDIGDALRAIRSLGPRGAVITCGEDGAHYSGDDGEGHIPAFQVDAVDTTGAGDVFHGAFAFALTQGWGLRDCVTFASAVSAIKCTRIGGRAGIPSFQRTIDFLTEHGTALR